MSQQTHETELEKMGITWFENDFYRSMIKNYIREYKEREVDTQISQQEKRMFMHLRTGYDCPVFIIQNTEKFCAYWRMAQGIEFSIPKEYSGFVELWYRNMVKGYLLGFENDVCKQQLHKKEQKAIEALEEVDSAFTLKRLFQRGIEDELMDKIENQLYQHGLETINNAFNQQMVAISFEDVRQKAMSTYDKNKK